jgi:hypothetical protein
MIQYIVSLKNNIRKRTGLAVLSIVFAVTAVIILGNAKPSSAATGCSALPSTNGTATLSSVSVPSTGIYHVWSRIKAPDTTNNSFYFQTDNNCSISIGDNSSITPGSWVWVDYRDGSTTSKADISLSAGNHPMELAGKEPGVQVDRVLLLSDTCVPTGNGDNCVITPDTTPPTTSITSPTNNSTVTGTVNLVAAASDNTAVTKVEFYIDGSLVSTSTTLPYSYSWDTTLASNGSHSLQSKAYDAAGNIGTGSAVTVTISNSATCKQSSTTWQNSAFATQTSNFTVDFDSTPLANNIDSVIGTSNNNATDYSSLATTVRFNSSGFIDAASTTGANGSYKADVSVPYTANTVYHLKLTINPVAHTYSIVVTPSGGSPINLATNYPFRTSQATLSTFNNWALFQDPASVGSHKVCAVTVAAVATGPKAGDINGDNAVNITDLSLILSSYGQNTTQCVTNNAFKCDLSTPGDGIVNIFDLSILLSNYGK